MVMNNDMRSFDDEELLQKLQELIEKNSSTEDDTDSDDELFDDDPITTTPQAIETVLLSLPADDAAAYTDGEITVNIRTGDSTQIKEDRFTCYVYTDDYSPMCNSYVISYFRRNADNDVNIIIHSFRIWLPGKYFLLVRDKSNGSLLRMDFEIGQSMNITQQSP